MQHQALQPPLHFHYVLDVGCVGCEHNQRRQMAQWTRQSWGGGG